MRATVFRCRHRVFVSAVELAEGEGCGGGEVKKVARGRAARQGGRHANTGAHQLPQSDCYADLLIKMAAVGKRGPPAHGHQDYRMTVSFLMSDGGREEPADQEFLTSPSESGSEPSRGPAFKRSMPSKNRWWHAPAGGPLPWPVTPLTPESFSGGGGKEVPAPQGVLHPPARPSPTTPVGSPPAAGAPSPPSPALFLSPSAHAFPQLPATAPGHPLYKTTSLPSVGSVIAQGTYRGGSPLMQRHPQLPVDFCTQSSSPLGVVPLPEAAGSSPLPASSPAQGGSGAATVDEVDDTAANRRRTRRTRILALLLRRAPEAKGYLTCILCCTMVWSPNGRHHIATCATLRTWRAARDAVWADAVAWLDARVAGRPKTTFPELLNGRPASAPASSWAGAAPGMAATAPVGDGRLTPGGRVSDGSGAPSDVTLANLCADIFDAVSEEDAAATADARAAPPKPAKVPGFLLGARRKGYVHCQACRRELWAPNCKRHVCAQRQLGIGGDADNRPISPQWSNMSA